MENRDLRIEDGEMKIETLFKEIIENFPNIKNELIMDSMKQRTPKFLNAKGPNTDNHCQTIKNQR